MIVLFVLAVVHKTSSQIHVYTLLLHEARKICSTNYAKDFNLSLIWKFV